MLFQSTPHILFPGFELPPRAMIGMEESYEVIGEVETDRNIHGRLITLTPTWMRGGGELHRIELTNSRDNVDTGLLDDLSIGTEVTFYSGKFWIRTIQPGMTSVELLRDPVPGSVSGRNPRLLKSDIIAVSVDGRTASIPAILPYPVNVYYRPQMVCQVVARDRGTMSRFGRSRSYGLTLEEVGPLE